ncbi:uncharacterized protein LOC132204067 isoform X2 [Neocloeon triangulifer]|uniref:uncharacterized protein LOC132204067 isoform X2 n=1 Tax=Neocloeon triangulifer TaxID=2078957 RepID=UPI00286EFEDC|nr:uncharacterized protein LOC132204067 isoform X2 [Neocloeon triangulifer]
MTTFALRSLLTCDLIELLQNHSQKKSQKPRLKMEIGTSWIWIFVICAFSLAPAQTRPAGKLTSLTVGITAKIYQFLKSQNFHDCGRWNQSGIAPWLVYLTTDGFFERGVLLSDQTVIHGNERILTVHKEGKEIKIYAGKCGDENDEQKCYKGRGLLQNKKVLKLKKVDLKHGRFLSAPIFVSQIEKVDLTPASVQPVCLWNRDNRNDQHEIFFSSDHRNEELRKVDFLPEQRCYLHEEIEKWRCDLYSNSICTSGSSDLEYLVIERSSQFYLRALLVESTNTTCAWLDLLPWTNGITWASVDLAGMPKIPKPKTKKDFGPDQSFADCGRRPGRVKREADEPLPLITIGVDAVRGQHPWHGSLTIHTETGPLEESCGATLISKKVLVTAAHCLFWKAKKLEGRYVDVTLGMYNRSNEKETRRQTLTASSLLVHPGFDDSRGDLKDDIGLIILNGEVTLTNFVRPICLWNDDYDLNKIANKIFTVVGWGLTYQHTQPDVLQKADITVVSYQQCFDSNKRFFSRNMRPRENFCAGIPQNEINACSGDSGGGLTFYDREVSRRHVLRGVVSMGLMRKLSEDFRTCNPKFYALYTDVTNYMDWIVENTPDINP